MRSNDSTQLTVKTTLLAVTRKMTDDEPCYINFATVELGSVVNRTVLLKNMCDTTVRLAP
ncbi:MAG: hypothetical protein ABSF91_14220 [Bacteroidota bacterium]